MNNSHTRIYWIALRTYSCDEAFLSTSVATTAQNSQQKLFVHGFNALEVKTLYIEPGNPWENGYIESFKGKLRDEVLNREVFDTLWEAKVLVERWRREYNHTRPHSSLGYIPPAPEAVLPVMRTHPHCCSVPLRYILQQR